MSKIKILLAEDDANLGTVLSTFLSAKDFEVSLCINGEIALERFKSQMFDFLILDVMMPIKDGFSVAQEIRETDQDIPILFLTAKSMADDKLKGFSSGADDYMTKPFAMDELLARINAILKRTSIIRNRTRIRCSGKSIKCSNYFDFKEKSLK